MLAIISALQEGTNKKTDIVKLVNERIGTGKNKIRSVLKEFTGEKVDNAKFLLGLSATPYRNDGLTRLFISAWVTGFIGWTLIICAISAPFSGRRLSRLKQISSMIQYPFFDLKNNFSTEIKFCYFQCLLIKYHAGNILGTMERN